MNTVETIERPRNIKIAEVGNIVRFKGGVEGLVYKVNENSVLVNIISNPTELFFELDVTVINHKRYKIVG